MNQSEYTLQTGKIMKSVNGKVVLNKQYAFDYDGEKANIILKHNKDLHEYKLTKKDINDLFTRIMNNKDMSLKDRLQLMLDQETTKSKSKEKSNSKSNSKSNNKSKNKNKTKKKTKKKKQANKKKKQANKSKTRKNKSKSKSKSKSKN